MASAEFSLEKFWLVRAEHDSDLVHFITEIAKKQKIHVAIFTVIGALKRAKLGFYSQERHEYREMIVETPHEIASCIGNVSIRNEKPFVHVHAVLADEKGRTKAGHLIEGIVFAAEIHLQALDGARLERKHDDITGLSLWNID